MLLENRSRDSGHYFIELSIALPLLLSLIFGTLDLASLYRASSALNAGLETAARCLYPIDAACQSGGNDQTAALYDVYREQRSETYLIPEFAYSLYQTELTAPVYIFPDLRARILDTLSYELPGRFFTLYRNYYPARRNIAFYVQTAGLPRISGDPRDPTLSAKGGLPLSPLRVPIRNVAGRGLGRRPLGAVSISVPSPDPATPPAPCFASAGAGNMSSADFESECKNPVSDMVPTVLYIRGDRTGAPGSRGSLHVELEGPDGTIDLGGERLDYSPGIRAANLVPRGSSPADIAEGTLSVYGEFSEYQHLRLRSGASYRLKFTLFGESGDVGWQGLEVSIYYPAYRLERLSLPCPGGVPGGEAAHRDACPLPLSKMPRGELEILSTSPERSELVTRYCGAAGEEASASVVELLDPRSPLPEFTRIPSDNSDCPEVARSVPCNSESATLGVPDLSEGEYIRQSSAAFSACPPLPFDLPYARNLRWSEKTVRPSAADSFEWQQPSCSASQPRMEDLPPGLRAYAKLEPGSPRLARLESICPGPSSPEELKGSPAYSCPEFGLRSSELPPPTQPAGVVDGCDWNDDLRLQAVSHGLDPLCGFRAERRTIGESRSGVPPRSECVPYRTVYRQDRNPVLVASGVNEGEARRLCAELGKNCRLEHVTPGRGSSRGPALQVSQALDLGFHEMEALIPSARRDCADPGCIVLSGSTEGGRIVISAKMTVPGTLLFRQRSVERRITRKLESSIPDGY